MSRSSFTLSCPAPSAVLRFLVLACIMVGLVGTGMPVSAQGNPAAASATRIAEAEAEVRAVDRALDSKVDDDDRRELRDRAQGAKDSTDQAVSDLTEQLDRWEAFCAERDLAPGQVALAWLLHRPGVLGPIIGPRTMEQLDSAIEAVDIALSDEDLAALDEIFPGPGGPAPEAYAW